MRHIVGTSTALDTMAPASNNRIPLADGPFAGAVAQNRSKYAGISHRISTYPPPVPICGKISYNTRNAAAESPSVVRQVLTGLARAYITMAAPYIATIGAACS